jgi:acyl homoserine lactone synthase
VGIIRVDWETAHLNGESWISHHRLRHRIFVARQAWDVPSYRGLEFDQFDTPAAKYLVWTTDRGQALGTTRLIPTTEPYMVGVLWPDLISGGLPASPQIWEASRFGCDHDVGPALRRRIVADLICACLEFGVEHGIHTFIGVMPLGVFNTVIRRAGCPVTLAGPARRWGAHQIAAGYIPVSTDVLRAVRQRRQTAPRAADHVSTFASTGRALPSIAAGSARPPI